MSNSHRQFGRLFTEPSWSNYMLVSFQIINFLSLSFHISFRPFSAVSTLVFSALTGATSYQLFLRAKVGQSKSAATDPSESLTGLFSSPNSKSTKADGIFLISPHSLNYQFSVLFSSQWVYILLILTASFKIARNVISNFTPCTASRHHILISKMYCPWPQKRWFFSALCCY